MALPEFTTINEGGQNSQRDEVRGVYDNDGLDESDEDCQIVKTREMLRPGDKTTHQFQDRSANRQKSVIDEEKEARKRERRDKMKKRVKSAAKTTGKAVTSSYTCGACVAIAGTVTMICGIIMISIGNNEKQIRDDAAGKNFMLIGGSIFFLFGLAMLAIAVIYTIVHFIRKRNKDAKDPFKIKKTEKEAREKEKAEAEGRVVTPVQKVGAPPPILPICAPEHEHQSVTEQRMKQARRQSLFTTSQSSNDIQSMGSHPPPMKKSSSAFNLGFLGGKKKGRSSSLQPLETTIEAAPSPLPPIKTSRSALNLEAKNSPRLQNDALKKANMSRAMHDRKFQRSQSAAQLEIGNDVFAMKGMRNGGLGQLPPITPTTKSDVHTISEVHEFEEDSEI